ncbi:factor of DNA methylation 4 isoform X1 [Morus notabilis]|uniref:factor of DNA methylation 4 isoform X1 n=1 Tax=Morus notabilis TaxID=981085 RepID=UPI000CED4BC1|nr:factor of DNA methylation 4 isoform X1 [Morus notabilis]
MKTMRKQMIRCRKELKDGETSTEAQDEEAGGSAELQEAPNKLVDVFETLLSTDVVMGDIGVKRLGQLNFTPFHKEMERVGRRGADALFRASRLCTLWENYIMNTSWHPFKVVKADEKLTEVIDNDDENLKVLLHDMGEEVYHAVTMALMEANEYNPKGRRNVVLELWNFKEDRKASLKEGITFVAEHYLEPYIIREQN